MSFRQKQINEILDEDRNINRRVVNNLQKQIKVFEDIKPPTTVNEAVNLDNILFRIDDFIDDLNINISNIDANAVGKISPNIAKYNRIMNMRTAILQKNHGAKNTIDSKIQQILPFLNSIVIGFNNYINEFIMENKMLSDFLTTQQYDRKINVRDNRTQSSGYGRSETAENEIALAQHVSEMSIFSLMRNNIANENYRPIDFSEVDIEFNKIVKNYSINIRKNLAYGLLNSASSGYKKQTGEILNKEIDKMENELKRKLTKQEELLLSIRVGGFSQFKPVLSNTEFNDLEEFENKNFMDELITPEDLTHTQNPSINLSNEDIIRSPVQPAFVEQANDNGDDDDDRQPDPVVRDEMYYRDDRNTNYSDDSFDNILRELHHLKRN